MGIGFRTRTTLVFRVATLMVVLSAFAPAPAHADLWCWLFGDGCSGRTASQQNLPDRSAPEIDPGALANAIALVAGGVVMLSDRVRRRR